jgi:hypothetical protein
MLNLLFQNSNEPAQEVYKIEMVGGPHELLNQVHWSAEKHI